MTTPTDLEYWMRRCGSLVKENSELGAEVSRLRLELEKPPKEAEIWRQEIREELVADWGREWKERLEASERRLNHTQEWLRRMEAALEKLEFAHGYCFECGADEELEDDYLWKTHYPGCSVGEALGRDLMPAPSTHEIAEANAGTPEERGWEGSKDE